MQRGVNRKWFFVCALLLLVVGVVAYGTSTPSTFGHSVNEIEGLSTFLGDAIPTGAILLFNTTCPSGWTRFTELDGRVPKGALTPGIFGGLDTHAHTYQSSMATNLNGGSWRSAIATLSIDPSSSWPPFLTMVWCMKTASGGGGSVATSSGPRMWSSDWREVQSSTSSVGNGIYGDSIFFAHNLNSSNIVGKIYVSPFGPPGINFHELESLARISGSGYPSVTGGRLRVNDNNMVTVELGGVYMDGMLDSPRVWGTTGGPEWIKVVLMAQ